jgi:hypothetical protein
VTIRVESQPSGATVTDQRERKTLGTTPLVVTVPRGAPLNILVEKEGGYDTQWVDTRRDQKLRFLVLPDPGQQLHFAQLIEQGCPAWARPIAAAIRAHKARWHLYERVWEINAGEGFKTTWVATVYRVPWWRARCYDTMEHMPRPGD